MSDEVSTMEEAFGSLYGGPAVEGTPAPLAPSDKAELKEDKPSEETKSEETTPEPEKGGESPTPKETEEAPEGETKEPKAEKEEAKPETKKEEDPFEQRYKDLQTFNDKRFEDMKQAHALQLQEIKEAVKAPEPAPEPEVKIDDEDYFDSPQQYIKDIAKQAVSSNVTDDPTGTTVETQEQMVSRVTLEVQECMARGQHKDYDQMIEVFKEAADRNPAINDKVWAAANPAEAAYSMAKEFAELKELGDSPSEMREKIREQERAKILAEMKTKGSEVPVHELSELRSGKSKESKTPADALTMDNVFADLYTK